MAYEELKAAIRRTIKNNDNQEITGDLLQNTLLSMVDTIGTTAGGGSGSGSGSGVSLGTLLAQLNTENPFPTDNGQVLTYNGSNFIWKIPTGSGGTSGGGSTTGGIRIKRNGSTLKDSNGDVLSCTSINFKYGENWNSTPILINSDNEISVDLSVVANNGNGSSSSSSYPLTIYNGSSNTDYITYDGSSAAYLRFKSGFSISKTGLGYEISASVSGGSSGTTSGRLRFYKDSSEESWNGESDFKIIFGSGLNVTWDSHSQITLSATGGGSGGSTSTSVSWQDVTNKPSTFTPSSHTHSTSEINGLSNYVQNTKVNNATNADKATQLANSRTIWGQSFNGTDNINGNLSLGTAGGGSIQLRMNDGNMLDRTGNTLSIGYGIVSNGEIILEGNVTKIYTDNHTKHYDFKSNVFDVNSNQIHFGSGTNGGKISWDAANNAFKIEGNVYATGGITALGVSNSATTSNNVDFTFNNVSARGGTFENLAAGYMEFKNGVINNMQNTISLKSNVMLYYGSRDCSLSLGNNTFTLRILSDIIKGFYSQEGGALSLNNVEKLIFGVVGQKYSRYKFDINNAISAGILVSTTETFSDEEADDTAVVAS